MKPQDVPDGPLIVDTDVASYIHLQRTAEAASFLPLLQAHAPLCLAFPTAAELRVLALRSRWGTVRCNDLERFIARHVVLPADDVVARRWSEIHAKCRDQLGVNDQWIAACALAHDLPIVTNNLKEFGQVANQFTDLVIVHPNA